MQARTSCSVNNFIFTLHSRHVETRPVYTQQYLLDPCCMIPCALSVQSSAIPPPGRVATRSGAIRMRVSKPLSRRCFLACRERRFSTTLASCLKKKKRFVCITALVWQTLHSRSKYVLVLFRSSSRPRYRNIATSTMYFDCKEWYQVNTCFIQQTNVILRVKQKD